MEERNLLKESNLLIAALLTVFVITLCAYGIGLHQGKSYVPETQAIDTVYYPSMVYFDSNEIAVIYPK